MIPLSVPEIRGNEWAYVKECLDTGWVSSAGKFVDRFEQEIARYTGARHAVACASGTAALHVALMLCGVRPEDEVLVPALTFIASVNVIRYLGAHPVFMDCDECYTLDAEKTAEFLAQETEFTDGCTRNKRTGRRISALLPVHVLGNAVQLESLLPLCREGNIRVVEDAAESLGTVYTTGAAKGRHPGTLGDVGCLSFNGNKVITTGGGGMILTEDPAMAQRAKYLTTQAKDDEARFVHHEVGYNYRLTNIQAALGLAQLEQLPGFLAVKRRNYQDYAQRLREIPGLRLAPLPGYADNNCWLCALQIDAKVYGQDREAVMARLHSGGIQSRPLWHLNHRQRPYRDCQTYRLERAPVLWDQSLCLPSSAGLSPAQVGEVVAALQPGARGT
jgi:aminotransferase in exopolysaccharide biosynthesis